MILSASWMLNLSFGLSQEAAAIETAIEAALENSAVTGDLGGRLTTSDVGDWIGKHIQNAHV